MTTMTSGESVSGGGGTGSRGVAIALQVCFWLAWFGAGLATVLLFVWGLELAPFKTGGRANEAAIVFFPVMIARWVALAACLGIGGWMVMRKWTRGIGWGIGVIVALLAVHLVLGLINLGVANAWMSVEPEKTEGTMWGLVAVYFGLPVAAMVVSAGMVGGAVVGGKLRTRNAKLKTLA